MSGEARSPVDRLAERVGILPEYVDMTGTEVRRTSDETRLAILRSMGLDGSSESAARAALRELDRQKRERLTAPVWVAQRGSVAASEVELWTGAALGTEVRWQASVRVEGEEPSTFEGVVVAGRGGRARVRLDRKMPDGYHAVRVRAAAGAKEREAEATLIVTPRACRPVKPAVGVIANLYTVRSSGDWGIGDFGSLAALLEWSGRAGGAFVGVNPLHAIRNRGWDVSPYSPVSRLFRNPIYLDPAQLPDATEEVRALISSPELAAERERLRGERTVQYEQVMALKRRVLERWHAGAPRSEEYRRYLDVQGEALERFATFEALAERLGEADWRRWPEPYRTPGSAEVRAAQQEHEGAVDFHRRLQFELDCQLAAAAERGRRAGLRVGLYQDLAIGTSPAGADVWANPDLFLTGLSIGAPPDDLGPEGQNWGLPPMDPRAMRESRYDFWIRLLRASFAHSGALRIDHVLGLFRQFWIPDGASGSAGAYVQFPVDDLLGILMLEAARHGAVVVGEDLGTVPPEVPPALRRRRILSSRVFYFERFGDHYRPASEYEPAALATANTHDLPPIAGYWSARDIQLRRQVGAIPSDEVAGWQWHDRERSKRAILERLAADGALPSAEEPQDPAELRGAVHRFLCSTPAALVGLNLDDLVGETEPVNLPGVPPDRYPSWTRKLAVPVEALDADPNVRTALRGVRR